MSQTRCGRGRKDASRPEWGRLGSSSHDREPSQARLGILDFDRKLQQISLHFGGSVETSSKLTSGAPGLVAGRGDGRTLLVEPMGDFSERALQVLQTFVVRGSYARGTLLLLLLLGLFAVQCMHVGLDCRQAVRVRLESNLQGCPKTSQPSQLRTKGPLARRPITVTRPTSWLKNGRRRDRCLDQWLSVSIAGEVDRRANRAALGADRQPARPTRLDGLHPPPKLLDLPSDLLVLKGLTFQDIRSTSHPRHLQILEFPLGWICTECLCREITTINLLVECGQISLCPPPLRLELAEFALPFLHMFRCQPHFLSELGTELVPELVELLLHLRAHLLHSP
mmetsp:Transcript_115958/g.368805  ORF Transcript_115958/g.368805 Transcript_115958/m.368805 type:complete len:338 (+) Transcript_115958:3053-4066(+)